jgi:YbbR domain-containing protein
MIAYGQTDVDVYVTLRAPESVWQILQAGDVQAVADISELSPGEHRVPVDLSVEQRPIMVRSYEPGEVTIIIEPVQEAVLPVRVVTEGSTTRGYEAGAATVTPLTVTVSGPASLATQVVEAVATVSVEGERASLEGEFVLLPLDAAGEVVPDVQVAPVRASVSIPIERQAGFRDLVVTAILEGRTAPGYSVARVAVDPIMIMVFGDQGSIDQIPGYIETIPLSLEGVQDDLEIQLPLQVPEGVTLVGQDPVVNVSVTVVPLEGSLTIQREVELQGLNEISATVTPELVDVTLRGPMLVLEGLAESDVRVLVDLSTLEPGIHSVEPRVIVLTSSPGDITTSVLPITVQVEIVALDAPEAEKQQ